MPVACVESNSNVDLSTSLMANFRGLVLGCIETDFCNQILILLHFFEIYKIVRPLHLSKLKTVAKNRDFAHCHMFDKKLRKFEFAVVQRFLNLVDLVKCCKLGYLVGKIGFDTAENEPSKVLSSL